MKRIFLIWIVAMIGFSTSSAQALLSASQSDAQISTNIAVTTYYEEYLDMAIPSELIHYFSTLTDDEREEKLTCFSHKIVNIYPKTRFHILKRP